jgi:hypothetical protein
VTAAGVGATASWVGGGIACVVLVVVLAITVPALRQYRTDAPAAGSA